MLGTLQGWVGLGCVVLRIDFATNSPVILLANFFDEKYEIREEVHTNHDNECPLACIDLNSIEVSARAAMTTGVAPWGKI